MRVLLVVHGYPPRAQGGSEIYAEAHARTLRQGHGDEVLVLTRESDATRPEYDVRETDERGVRVVWVNNTFRDVRSFDESYTQPRIAAIASAVIADYRPDVAHVHHLTCLSTLIPQRLAEAGVPCFMTLHDYWLLCHRGQLLDLDGRVCVQPGGGCDRCIAASAALPAAIATAAPLVRRLERSVPEGMSRAIRTVAAGVTRPFTSPAAAANAAERRAGRMRDVSSHITHFFAPSRALRDRFIEAGLPSTRISSSPYGFDHAPFSATSSRTRTGPLRIGFIGSLMVSKAPHLLLEALSMLPAGSAQVDIFGAYSAYHGDDSYRAVITPLLAGPDVKAHGPVPHERMADAFGSIDVLVVPSIWPENSPLVVSEAFLAGVPVIASDIGGMPELVRDGENGLLFEAGNVRALRAALTRVLEEPALLDRLRAGRPAVPAIEDDVRAMRARYETALEATRTAPRHTAHASAPAPDAPRVHAVVLNYNTPDQTVLAVRSLLASRLSPANVIVVDNSENVTCGRALATVADRVEYVSSEANLGYAGGMNIGICRALAAGATHVLLVNSDMSVPPDCIATLVDGLSHVRGSGIGGATVLARSMPDRIATMGLSYDRGSGRMRQRGYLEPAQSAPVQPVEVDAVSGCLMLVAREVFERIGGFDDAYFFGFEDLDFCLRAKAAGFSSIITAAVAYHEGAGSLPAASPDRLYYGSRNHLRLAAAVDSGSATLAQLLRRGLIVAFNAAFALKASPARIPARLLAVAHGVSDFHRGRFGPRRRA